MANMTTRAIAQKANRQNKDIMKYIRYNKISYKEATYKTKNNRSAKEYILSTKDAEKIIKKFNKNYEAPVKVQIPVNKPIAQLEATPLSVIVPEDKQVAYLNIYAKYAVNSKNMRTIVLENLFKANKPTGMTPDDAFNMLVDTIDAFALHDSISGFTYQLANDKVPKFKRSDRSYHHFLKSLYWAIIRDKHLQDHPVCCGCGTTHNLQVHHPDYNLVPRGTEYLHMNYMATMCDSCHKKVHDK